MRILIVNYYSNLFFRIAEEVSNLNSEVTMITSVYNKNGTILNYLSKMSNRTKEIASKKYNPSLEDKIVLVRGECLKLLSEFVKRAPLIHHLYFLIEKASYYIYILETIRYLKQNQFDVVIFYDPYLLIDKLVKSKITILKVFMMTGAAPDYVVNKLMQEESKFMNYDFLKREFDFNDGYIRKYNSAINDIDLIIAPSRYALDSIQVVINRGVIIPFGLMDLPNNNYENRKNSKLRIVFIGRATILKGFHYLIELAKLLESEEIELLIIGGIKDEIIDKLPKLKNLKFLGKLNNDDVRKVLKTSDIMFHPTLTEGMSLSIMEAMNLGVPVITSISSGYENIITNKSGFIYEEIDLSEIKKIISELNKDRTRLEEMGRFANNTIIKLDWKNHSRILIKTISDSIIQLKKYSN
jgi:glycosyltransferase involved in cell wall biosynthesis